MAWKSAGTFWRVVALVNAVISLAAGARPVIQYFSQPGNVPEDPTIEMKLVEIIATDADGDAITSCQVRNVLPNGPFNAQRKGGDANFWVYYDATRNLNYATINFYELRLECTDATNQISDPVDLFIHVVPNSAPAITNYPTDSATLDANTFNHLSDSVYTITATDPEGDSLTYSIISQQPGLNLFSIDSVTGEITAKNDLRDQITDPSFILTVRVSDGKNSISDFKLLVTLNNLNTAPVFRNLPTTVTVSETAGIGTTISVLTVEDATQYPGPIVPSCTTMPSNEDFKFQYDSVDASIKLTGDNLLDYETRDLYTIICTVTDGFYTSSGTLTVNVNNVNEGPQFDNTDYYCIITESNQRVNFCTLSLNVADPEGDALDSIKFQTAPDSDKFHYDKTSKRVYFNVDYDIDSNTMPSTVDLVLEATDSAGATATANVHITVTDGNDNVCQFDQDVLYQTINQNTALGLLDAFTVTDSDLTSPNKDANVQIVSQNPSNSDTYITVTGNGELYYIASVSPANRGSSYTMLVRCIDGGSPPKSALATVIVSYTTATTTTTASATNATTTTTPAPEEKDIWDFEWFIAVFSLLMFVVLVALIAALSFLCYKCCCQNRYGTNKSPHKKNKVDESDKSTSTSGSRSRSSVGDDDYSVTTSARSEYRPAKHTWQNGIASPRQIPALEYN